jgi:ATP-dependent Lhr-like helicase
VTHEYQQRLSFFIPNVQQWICLQNWTELREVQEEAVRPILRGDTDVIIAASTASGKTEAAFLPIASSLAAVPDRLALVIYVSPLKALINDQYGRLGPFFEHLDLPAWPWHGDVSATRKKRFRSDGRGVLLITPESLEALFVSSGHSIHHIFRYLKYVVIDELHSFLGTERGKQLQSLLHRLETAVERQIPRIGLSATLGELSLAAEYLRPLRSSLVHIIESNFGGQELKLLVRGYEEKADSEQMERPEEATEDEPDETGTTKRRIVEDLFQVLRGTNNLVFANSRAEVESYADLLRIRCEQDQLPAEFWPHHGSLSKDCASMWRGC